MTAKKHLNVAQLANDEAKPASDKPSRAEAEDAVRTLLRWAGDDPAREGLVDRVRRENTEADGHIAALHKVAQAVRHAFADVVEVRRAAADHGAEGDKGVDPVISNRLEDMQLSNITNERKHARKAVEVTTKPDEIAKESLEFPANGDYACRNRAQLDAPYSNPRLRGLDWIDENGHDKYVGSAKRAKR